MSGSCKHLFIFCFLFSVFSNRFPSWKVNDEKWNPTLNWIIVRSIFAPLKMKSCEYFASRNLILRGKNFLFVLNLSMRKPWAEAGVEISDVKTFVILASKKLQIFAEICCHFNKISFPKTQSDAPEWKISNYRKVTSTVEAEKNVPISDQIFCARKINVFQRKRKA